MDESKRKTQRLPMFKVVCYTIDGRSYADLSTNISDGGIFVKNFSPPPVGTMITLTVQLPEQWGNLPLHVSGKVVHADNDPDPHKRGMGIEFISVAADSLPIIEYFVREVYKEDLKQDQLKETYKTASNANQQSQPAAGEAQSQRLQEQPTQAEPTFEYSIPKDSRPSETAYKYIKKKD